MRVLRSATVLFVYATLAVGVHSFVPPNRYRGVPEMHVRLNGASVPVPVRASSKLYFFRRKNNEAPEPKKEPEESSTDDAADRQNSLFGFLKSRTENQDATAPVATIETKPVTTVATTPPRSATEEAARLRSEADRARLEADRLDAELTLRKIGRLEKELAAATAAAAADSSSKPRKSSDDLQREIDTLLRKVRGDSDSTAFAPATNGAQVPPNDSVTTERVTKDRFQALTNQESTPVAGVEPVWPRFVRPFDEEEYKELYDRVKNMPQFMQGTVALMVEATIGTDPETGKTLVDTEDLVKRMYQLDRLDMSFSSKPPPVFTQSQLTLARQQVTQIVAQKNATKEGGAWWTGGGGNSLFETFAAESAGQELVFLDDDRFGEALKDEPETVARLVLEYQYYIENELKSDEILSMASEEPWLKPFVGDLSFSMVDSAADRLYPKCTTKRDTVDKEKLIPTEAQVNQLVPLLSSANFRSTSKPEPVLGGFIIRGSTSLSGDALMDKLDSAMERANLKDKMTVLYTTDFSVLTDNKLPEDEPPILYVVSANVCRDSKPLPLSIVSAFGLATSWYLSVYPFLLNPTIASRVDEQLAIADANMVPDLAWLTDLSVPLFATYIGIQLVHELGHLVVAGSNKIQTTSPTFVPSLITGITSTVTTFKSPPLNKAAMFDFSVAGPLAGILASILAIVVGVQVTTVADPTLFPALPVEILRQSTLGGGLIEMGLGNGALNVPEGALGTAAVAGMTVPLHPIAIAGYISLIVNALALLPVGTTDGGRVALALFGRGGKAIVGTLVFFVMLISGLVGSDLFLFYFAFCIAFQAGNEIPARNEVDKLDLPRCFLAGLTYLVAFLAIVPFQ